MKVEVVLIFILFFFLFLVQQESFVPFYTPCKHGNVFGMYDGTLRPFCSIEKHGKHIKPEKKPRIAPIPSKPITPTLPIQPMKPTKEQKVKVDHWLYTPLYKQNVKDTVLNEYCKKHGRGLHDILSLGQYKKGRCLTQYNNMIPDVLTKNLFKTDCRPPNTDFEYLCQQLYGTHHEGYDSSYCLHGKIRGICKN